MSRLVTCLGIFVLLGAMIVIARKFRPDQGNKIPMLVYVRENFKRLDPEFAKIPLYEGGKSYTENKSSITLCLKDEKGLYYDRNTIMYVALHELAHIVTKTYDMDEHGPEFRKNFDNILNRAQQLGIYDPKLPVVQNYCGVDD